MKSITSLALRYLWQQKKRTCLTILGIIISVSMITSIGIILVSFRDAEIERQKETEGAFHVRTVMDKEQYKTIVSNPKIDKTAYSLEVGRGYVDDTVISLSSYLGEHLYLSNFALSEGREPKEIDEIALDAGTARQLGLSVGDTILMSVNGIYRHQIDEETMEEEIHHIEDKEFEISGLVEVASRFNPQMAFVSYEYATEISLANEGTVHFTVKDGLSVREVVEDIQKQQDNAVFSYNNALLLLKGQVTSEYYKTTLISLASVVMFLVLVVCGATVAVIYNSFNISVLERIRQFGIMRSIGTTPKQIRRIVFVEAGLQALIAVPLGLISGIVAMNVVFYLLSTSVYSTFNDIFVSYSLSVLLVSAAIGTISVLFSAFIPAVLAGRKQPLEAVFHRPKNKKKFKRWKGFIIKRFLSAEKTLAYKNLQRNKKRTIVTAFALSISVILFIVFSVFSYYAFKIQDTRDYYDYDFQIMRTRGDTYTEEDYKKIKNLESIHEVKPLRVHQAFGLVDEGKISDEFKNSDMYTDNVIGGQLYGYSITQLESAKEYLLDGKADNDLMVEENGVLLVQTSIVYTDNVRLNKQIIDYEIGDKIDVVLNWEEAKRYIEEQNDVESQETITLTVVGILENDPIYNNHGIKLITAEEFYRANIREGYDKFYINAVEDLDGDTHMQLTQELSSIAHSSDAGSFFDNYYFARRDRQLMLEVSVFIYGFIVLISIIGALNIINTISTNLLTRTKEFAMLRAVGMGPKSLINMIRYEAILSGVIGVIYGCITGNLLGYWLYNLMNDVREVPWEFPWTANIIVIIAAIVVSLLASRATVQRVKKMNIIDTLREE
ncbi:FtsX-like permease family protein [Proteinivorax hydrogeniformans]|uniref:FtsX-like permease family protein n=1 Tax=Proteinivorax hydrogeniformans TaxID=1826727 RepID=A0AAU8HTA7_9FIRM